MPPKNDRKGCYFFIVFIFLKLYLRPIKHQRWNYVWKKAPACLKGLLIRLYLCRTRPSRGALGEKCSENCSKFNGEHQCRSTISIKLLCKYAANWQENTHAKAWFQLSCFATLLKSHFGMGSSCKFARYFQNTVL